MEDMPASKKNSRPPLTQARDLISIGLRHRRLVMLTFLGLSAGVLLSLFLLPPRYKATTKILVKKERADFVVTADPNDAQQQAPAAVSETDLNSEIELMKSEDLLEKVVVTCGLQNAASSGWLAKLPFMGSSSDPHKVISNAARDLSKSMDMG